MLIDPHDPRYIDLNYEPNHIIAAVRVRTWELEPKECPWGASKVHGEEGVWRLDDGQQHVRLGPFTDEEPYRLLFDLRPVFLEPPRPHVLSRFRWLIRYWDADVYMPTIQGMVVTAETHLEEDGGELFWTVAWGRHTISGVRLRVPE